MKTMIKRFFKGIVTTILALQIGFFLPSQAQASFFSEVLDAAAQAGGWPADLPSPTALIALIDVATACTDTSDQGLINCVQEADKNPITHELMGGSADKILLGIGLYIDIKNGDYLAIIVKLGKTAGCAAAAILTGVPVCALAELVAAVVGVAVEAVAEAANFLGDLIAGTILAIDRVITGPPPASTLDEYYAQYYRPYLNWYVEKGVNGSVDGNTPIKAWVSESAMAKEVYWEQMYDLEPRSLAQIQQKCGAYYKKVERSAMAAQCSNLTQKFNAEAASSIAYGKVMRLAGPAIQTILNKNHDIWTKKYDAVTTELGPNSVSQYGGYNNARLGKTVAGKLLEVVANADYTGSPANSVAALTFIELRQDLSKQPLTILSAQLKAMEPQLQQDLEMFKAARKSILAGNLAATQNKDRMSKVVDTHRSGRNALQSSISTCGALSPAQNKAGCLKSQPLVACLAYSKSFTDEASAFINPPVGLSADADAATFDKFILTMKTKLEGCVRASDKVTDEWKRLSAIYPEFLSGWINHCNANHKNAPHSDCNSTLGAYLVQAYNGCVESALDPIIDAAVALVDPSLGRGIPNKPPKRSTPAKPKKNDNAAEITIGKNRFCQIEGAAAFAQIKAGIFASTDPDPAPSEPTPTDPRRGSQNTPAGSTPVVTGKIGTALSSVPDPRILKNIPATVAPSSAAPPPPNPNPQVIVAMPLTRPSAQLSIAPQVLPAPPQPVLPALAPAPKPPTPLTIAPQLSIVPPKPVAVVPQPLPPPALKPPTPVTALSATPVKPITGMALIPKTIDIDGCSKFLGRAGELLCNTDRSFSECKPLVDSGKLETCRRTGATAVYKKP